jgi:hypothetical protein
VAAAVAAEAPIEVFKSTTSQQAAEN